MKRRIMKKSEVLREGYIKGLRKAKQIINEVLSETDDDKPSSYTVIAYTKDDAIEKVEDEFGATIEHCEVDEIDAEEYDPELELDWEEHLYHVNHIVWA